MYAALTFSWKLSWRLPWHKTWFYTECGLALRDRRQLPTCIFKRTMFVWIEHPPPPPPPPLLQTNTFITRIGTHGKNDDQEMKVNVLSTWCDTRIWEAIQGLWPVVLLSLALQKGVFLCFRVLRGIDAWVPSAIRSAHYWQRRCEIASRLCRTHRQTHIKYFDFKTPSTMHMIQKQAWPRLFEGLPMSVVCMDLIIPETTVRDRSANGWTSSSVQKCWFSFQTNKLQPPPPLLSNEHRSFEKILVLGDDPVASLQYLCFLFILVSAFVLHLLLCIFFASSFLLVHCFGVFFLVCLLCCWQVSWCFCFLFLSFYQHNHTAFKTGIRVSEEGGGGLEFSICQPKNFFLSFPSLTPIVSDIQYDFSEEKSPKSGKNTGSKCSLMSCLAGYAPPLSVCVVLCTHKRYLATVTLIPGLCFRSRWGGGGASDFTTIERSSQTSIFQESLGPKGSNWCGFNFRSMHPSGDFRAAQS